MPKKQQSVTSNQSSARTVAAVDDSPVAMLTRADIGQLSERFRTALDREFKPRGAHHRGDRAVAAMTLVEQAMADLRSTRCACGNRKREQAPFCVYCHRALREEQPDIFAGLSASVSGGYIASWQSAREHLRKIGRVA